MGSCTDKMHKVEDIRAFIKGFPRPHYLTGNADYVENDEGILLRTSAIFPSSDPSIGDRKDHANVSHCLFGLWNATHVIASFRGNYRTLARKVEIEALRITPPDTPIDLSVRVSNIQHGKHKDKETISCDVNAEYSLDRKVLEKIYVQGYLIEK
jgi:hypothetical protein